jgi:thioredoxin 1
MIAMNEELFNKMAQEGAEPVLVEFWAPWCVYCRRIAPAYEKIAEQYAGKLTVAKVNIDEQPKLADRENIEVIPTLVLYKGGQALGFIVAPDSKAAIEEFIEELI